MVDFVFQENASIVGAINISTSQLVDKENSSSSVKFRIGMTEEVAIDSTAEYYDSQDNLLMSGKIKIAKELSYDKATGSTIFELTIYDNGYALVDGNLNEIYRDKTAEFIIEDIVTLAGLSFVDELPGASGLTIPKKTYLDRDPIEGVNELCNTLGANWRVEGNTFYLFRRGDTLSSVLIDGNQTWTLNKDGWKSNTDKKASTVIIKDAVIDQRTSEVVLGTGKIFTVSRTPIDVEIVGFVQSTTDIIGDYTVDKEEKTITFLLDQTDPEIFYSYESQVRAQVGNGEPIQVLNRNYIEDVIQARKLGRKYIEIFGDGIQSSTWINNEMFTLDLNDLIVGNQIQVNNKLNTNHDGTYVITKVIRKYPVSNQVTVGEDDTSIYNWQAESKDRIKQLEERDQNSDFVQLDVYKTGKVKVMLTSELTTYNVIENDGQILWASDTPQANDSDLISDTGPDIDYAIAYDDGSLPPGTFTDLLNP